MTVVFGLLVGDDNNVGSYMFAQRRRLYTPPIGHFDELDGGTARRNLFIVRYSKLIILDFIHFVIVSVKIKTHSQ